MDNQKMNIENKTSLVRVLRTLGDETRFQIIKLLLDNDLCVGALARIMDISKPAVSQHLKILREAGLIRGDKRGYWTHYKVQREPLRESARQLQALIETPAALDNNSYICLRTKVNESKTERRVLKMCENCCAQPDKLKTKPEECTPEQIKECHGDQKEHSCETRCEKPDKLKTKPEECTPEQIKECHGDQNGHQCE